MSERSVWLTPRLVRVGALVVLMTLAVTALPRVAAAVKLPTQTIAADLRSGAHAGNRMSPAIRFRDRVAAPGAPWMRLHFSEAELGPGSELIMTPSATGKPFRMNRRQLAAWEGWTPVFRGDQVEVELVVGKDDAGASFAMDRIVAGLSSESVHPPQLQNICGLTDDRTLSSDPRIGRLITQLPDNYIGTCTAWLLFNGALVTAGHCVDEDDNGTIDFQGGSYVEFDVPLSDSNGDMVDSSPEDQYPVNTPSFVFDYNGIGDDWCVFGTLPSLTSGDRVTLRATGFRLTLDTPDLSDEVRVIGYGDDDTPLEYNNVQQTDDGAYDGLGTIGGGIAIQHRADTKEGTSGGPVIWIDNGVTIGNHTTSECPLLDNRGTSWQVTAFANAAHDFLGSDVRYVDGGHPASIGEFGTATSPCTAVSFGVIATPDGGKLYVAAGDYPAASGNTFVAGSDGRALTILALNGSAVIGVEP